jgi:uncharacterized protein YggU (UPF0235/DUF167 family)
VPSRKPSPEGIRVAVRVRPGASRTAVGGRHGDALVVSVTPRANAGQATQAALAAVADAFAVPRRDVTLLRGAASRDKLVLVAGSAQVLSRRLATLLSW